MEEEIIRYKDNQGNEIKVLSGYKKRRGIRRKSRSNCHEEEGCLFDEYVTEIYENGHLFATLSEGEVSEDLVLPIVSKLEELAEGGGDAEEVEMAIRTIYACQSETPDYN